MKLKLLTVVASMMLLVSCAETPSKPTTSGGSSSGSGKVVTATPEEPYECDGDLILEPHLPEECIPPEPLKTAQQNPREPLKPDPVVGTYRTYNKQMNVSNILRIYDDKTALNATWGTDLTMRWDKDVDSYKFFSASGNYHYSIRIQSVEGEPDLVAFGGKYIYGSFEAIKLSSDPNYLSNLFKVGCIRKQPEHPCYQIYDSKYNQSGLGAGWHCINIGRLLSTDLDEIEYLPARRETPRDYGNTQSACQAVCETAMTFRFEEVGEGNCSDYQG